MYDCGVKVMRNLNHENMGIHTIWSGSAIQNYCEFTGRDSEELFGWYNSPRFKISRFDIRIDGYNFSIKPIDFANATENGQINTRAHSKTFVHGIDSHADTLYIGSMKKRNKLVRIYDKGKEQNLDVDWLRVEAEFRGNAAKSTAHHLFNKTQSMSTAIKVIIVGLVDFPEIKEWSLLMGENGYRIIEPYKGLGNTENWLLSSVTKSLARVMVSDPLFKQRFDQVTEHIYLRLLNGQEPFGED